MWGVYFKIRDEKINHLFNSEQEKLEKVSGHEFVNKFIEIKEDIHLDINFMTFEREMHLVNDLLFEKNMFLLLYEKKSKFRYLFRKVRDKNEVQKEVSFCIEQRYNGFHVTGHVCEKNCQIDFMSVGIVYEPVKRMDEIIECYFTYEINEAFILRFQHSKNGSIRSATGFVCYYWSCYCTLKKIFEKHLHLCARKPGVVYSFNNKHLSTFEDIFKLMADQVFSVYFDVGTTWKI